MIAVKKFRPQWLEAPSVIFTTISSPLFRKPGILRATAFFEPMTGTRMPGSNTGKRRPKLANLREAGRAEEGIFYAQKIQDK